MLVVSKDHPLADKKSVPFADILDQNFFVGIDRSSAIQRFLADKAARIGKPLRLRIQLRSFDAVCRMVESNVGIGIVPETTARRAAKTINIGVVSGTRALRLAVQCRRRRAHRSMGGARPHHCRARARGLADLRARACLAHACGQQSLGAGAQRRRNRVIVSACGNFFGKILFVSRARENRLPLQPD